jgi:hypothetical protein
VSGEEGGRTLKLEKFPWDIYYGKVMHCFPNVTGFVGN